MWQVDKAIFDRAGDRVHPHYLLHFRLIPSDAVKALASEFLDEFGARAFIFDQNCRGVESDCLFSDRALEFGVFHAPPMNVLQIEVLALLSPGCADTVIAQL